MLPRSRNIHHLYHSNIINDAETALSSQFGNPLNLFNPYDRRDTFIDNVVRIGYSPLRFAWYTIALIGVSVSAVIYSAFKFITCHWGEALGGLLTAGVAASLALACVGMSFGSFAVNAISLVTKSISTLIASLCCFPWRTNPGSTVLLPGVGMYNNPRNNSENNFFRTQPMRMPGYASSAPIVIRNDDRHIHRQNPGFFGQTNVHHTIDQNHPLPPAVIKR